MHSQFTALYDACVLYPATLRIVLMQLATTGLFRARWSDAIHDEWTSALRRARSDITQEQCARLRALMNAAVPDALVTGYEPLIEGLRLPDPDDRHVLAAAVRSRAEVIVTVNLADFPRDALVGLGIHAQHPDEFSLHLLDLDADLVCDALQIVRSRLKKPVHSVESFLALLESQRLDGFAHALRSHANRL